MKHIQICHACGFHSFFLCDKCGRDFCEGQMVEHGKSTICLECAGNIRAFAESAALLFGFADLAEVDCAQVDSEIVERVLMQRNAEFAAHFEGMEDTAADAVFELPAESIRAQGETFRRFVFQKEVA